ncbi:MAG: hypothetical protein M1839_009031 [Geoglossum umbratile]|nr:MAG: hypothetical protein M1839_009031 [Geoglossum umbratile]
MSRPSNWLRTQRKPELVDLAELAGLQDYQSLKKPELEIALDDHLRANQSSLSKDPRLEPFYDRVFAPSSPVKREVQGFNGAGSDGDMKPPKSARTRRVTKVANETQTTDDSSPDPPARRTALAARTPRSNLTFASSIPLPPSPAVVADAIDRRTAILRSKVGHAWENSGVTEKVYGARELLSSVVSVEAIVLSIELLGVGIEIMPLRYAFEIPAIDLLNTPSCQVSLPDLFLLLTSSFWSPFTLWISTSLLIPLVFAYFFNITLRAKTSHHMGARARPSPEPQYLFDPLAFNIVKALVTWLVFAQGLRFGGLVGDGTVDRIQGSVPGGYEGVLIGAGVGVLVSIYDAVLKK